jgi:hypothetical protein
MPLRFNLHLSGQGIPKGEKGQEKNRPDPTFLLSLFYGTGATKKPRSSGAFLFQF